MSKKDFKTFNLENEINNTVEHFKMHEFSHDTNYDAYNNYFNKKLTLTYSNKIYYYYNYTNNSDYKIIDLSYRNCELNLFKNIEGNGNIDNYNFYDTKFGMVGNHNYPGNACFLFGNLDTTTNSLNINYHNLSCNNGNLALYGFSIKNINIINDGNKVSFKGIHLKNNHLLNQLLIDNVEIGELNLENINNNFDSFEIRNCKIDKLIIRNSNLGKAVFNGVEIGKLEIENATLNDCIFNGVDFKTYELEEIKNGDSVNYKCMKDNYRQLKHVMDKNMNYSEANEFYALEMNYLRKYYYDLKLDNLSKDEYINRDAIIKSNRIILDYLYGINNYGTNILRNLFVIYLYLFFITITSGFSNFFLNSKLPDELMHLISFSFVLFLVFIAQYKLGYNINNLNKKILPMKIFYIVSFLIFSYFLHLEIGRFHGIETFIYLINPFSGLTPNSMSHLLWSEQLGMIIHKIIYGILIYQLIIALKRTTKR